MFAGTIAWYAILALLMIVRIAFLAAVVAAVIAAVRGILSPRRSAGDARPGGATAARPVAGK